MHGVKRLGHLESGRSLNIKSVIPSGAGNNLALPAPALEVPQPLF
jgi:hypothetical protein